MGRPSLVDYATFETTTKCGNVLSVLEIISGTKVTVTCNVCKEKGREPEGGWVIVKGHLIGGKVPCKCSKSYRKSPEEWLEEYKELVKTHLPETNHVVGTVKVGYETRAVITCDIFSQDPELYPETFTARKGNIQQGKLPCGCGMYQYPEDKWVIIAERKCKELGYTFEGWDGDFKGDESTCKLTCPDHGSFTLRLGNLRKGSVCEMCRLTENEDEKLEELLKVFKTKGYIFLEWVDGYKGLIHTKVRYKCSNPDHGIRESSLKSLLEGKGCKHCARHTNVHYGYYPSKKDEPDYLYIMKGEGYLKLGRSFNPEKRLKDLKIRSKDCTLETVYLFRGIHREIQPIEQDLLSKYEHLSEDLDWTGEGFKNEALELLLDEIKTKEVTECHLYEVP